MPTIFDEPSTLLGAVGRDLGHTDWIEITQERIDRFADATGDHQWIHVDPVRAKSGPFGTTVAHGYLTLSLTNLFLPQLIEVRGISMGVNYGCNKVRFPAAVPVGSFLRGAGKILAVEEVKGGVQSTVEITVQIDGKERPACVVESISRYFPM